MWQKKAVQEFVSYATRGQLNNRNIFIRTVSHGSFARLWNTVYTKGNLNVLIAN